MPSAKGKTSGAKGKKGGAGARPTGGKATKSLKTKPQKAAPKKSAAAAKGKAKSPAKPAASKKNAPARKAKPSPAPKKGVKPAKKAAPKTALKTKPKAAQKVVKAKPKAQPKAQPKGKAAKATPKAAAKPAPKVASRAAAAGKKAAAVTKKAVQKVRETAKHPVAVAAVAAAAGAAVPPVARRVAASVRGHEAAAENGTEAPKRARRGRSRIHSDEPPTANWFNMTGSKPRPSSFIPAPPRAEAPSATAAPPASSDRILHPEHLASLTLPAIRTFPIRVEIEQATGRTHVMIQPSEVTVRPGDGLEWDFRYLGGADTFISEVSIEFSGHVFAQPKFVSKNPGSARPHRLLSGRLPDGAGKGAHNYRVRCKSLVGTEVADAIGVINVV